MPPSSSEIFASRSPPTRAISRPTDVVALGYKHASRDFLFELGFVEDYNQQRNEADITLFAELGWSW